jgi:hypothetical protein
LETCRCGYTLREFWVWRDTNDVLHASSFSPSVGAVRSVWAATSRDALLPYSHDPRLPKHDVHEGEVGAQMWDGRCSAPLAATG